MIALINMKKNMRNGLKIGVILVAISVCRPVVLNIGLMAALSKNDTVAADRWVYFGAKPFMAEELVSVYASAGKDNQLRLLLAHGGDPNSLNSGQWTALIGAIAAHRPTTVTILLDSGADPNLVDGSGKSPLMVSNENHFNDISRILKARGARSFSH